MKSLFSITILLLFSIPGIGQRNLVSGMVTNAKGDPLPGVTVIVGGTSTGTSTDNNGRYRITAQKGQVIYFTLVGMVPRQLTVDTARIINVILEVAQQNLQEVVVTGYMVQKKKSLTGSVTRVSASAISSYSAKKLKTWQRNGELDENSVQLFVGDKDMLPLKKVQVAVQVDGFRARLIFDYFFYSDKAKQLRGNFKLKLPAGASPCYFAFGNKEYLNTGKQNSFGAFVQYAAAEPMYLDADTLRRQRITEDLREAMVVPKEKAAYAYNEVVRGRADPALMEWAGADIFSCSVYPIQYNKIHHIVIGYDINLQEADAAAVLNISLPYGDIPKQLDIDVALPAGSTHTLEPAIKNGLLVAGHTKYQVENFKTKQFDLYTNNPGPVFLQNESKEKYFAVSVNPEVPEIPVPEAAANAVFMLDVSLSSQPDKFNVWLKTIKEILSTNEGRIKNFAVLCFNVDAFWWRDFYSVNNENNVAEFLAYADELSLVGATDLYLALQKAAHPQWLKNKTKMHEAKTIFIMSDGDASWGETNLFRLSKNIDPQDKVFTFTTGLSGTDTRTLDHLSRQTNGAVFSVLNEEEVMKVSRSIQYKPWRIKTITASNGTDLLIAGRPYFVFAGQKLIITGRGHITPGSFITLVLQQGSSEKIITIPATAILHSPLTTRVYGQVAVQQLEDFGYATEKASVNYATHFAVAGQTCSWLMLERKNLYDRYNINTDSVQDYIQKNLVSNIISKTIAQDTAEKSLGTAKADLKAWISKLQTAALVDIKTDALFTQHLALMPEAAFEAAVQPLEGSIINSLQWSNSTNNSLAKNSLDYDELTGSVKFEKRMEGSANAFKLISSLAETNRHDITMLRDIAFTLYNWKLYGKSYELSKRLVLTRPAEPPSYNAAAASLVKMGYTDLAMVYYDLAFFTNWDGRFDGCKLITAVEYYRLLKEVIAGRYLVQDSSFAIQRLQTINEYLQQAGVDADGADIMIVITWNTDNTDVDLHVREPNNEECYYSHPKTANGGFLSNDATEGFGPEMYFMKKAVTGKYYLDIDYFSSSRVQTDTKTKILVTAYKNWGRANEERLQKIVALKRDVKRKNSGDDADKILKNVVELTF